MSDDWTWKDLVDMVVELLCINSVETYEDEYDECNGPMGSVDFILERELCMFKENLDDELYNRTTEMIENIKKKIKEDGYEEELAKGE